MIKSILRQLTLCVLLSSFIFHTTTAQDIMSMGGSLTVSQDNSGGPTAGEGSLKLVDGTDGKFLIGGVSFPLWAQWECTTAIQAGQYTIKSGNDAQDRDPRSWLIQGSNDGTGWTTIDTRSNETFATRLLQKVYDIANPGIYKYYRLYITANAGSSDFQVTEWRLLVGTAPTSAPSGVSGVALSGTQVFLNWTNNSTVQTSVEIERSLNAIDFTTIGSVDGLATSFSDASAPVGKRIYYRLRAVNAYGASGYSTITSVTTPSYGGELMDITDDGGTLTVEFENSNSAENSAKLIDNNNSTKYLIPSGAQSNYGDVGANYWIQYEAKNLEIVTSYTITSGNDAQGRDPKDWELLGSNDGTTWATLDTRSGEVFSGRNLTRTFLVSGNSTPFIFYKWHITANYTATQSIPGQISEWQIFGIDPTAPLPPSDLAVTGVGVTTASIAWTDNSSDETGFEVQRSEDGSSFTTAATLAPGVTSYTDENLLGAYTYYYRVRALGTTANSVWSSTVDTTTDYDPNLPITPSDVEGTALSETEISLTWTDRSDNETGFRIERSADGNNFTEIGTTGTDENTFVDQGLTLATMYYYRVMAFNDYGDSYYSKVATAITGGMNQAPTLDPITDWETCNPDSSFTFTLTGITPGPEEGQTVLATVTSDNSALFDELAITSVQEDGTAVLTINPAKLKDTAIVTVTVTDDGGTLNGGADTYTQSFQVIVTPLSVSISSDQGTKIQRYATAHLTASGADSYTWSDAHGVVSGQSSSVLTIEPTINTTYTVLGYNAEGCKDTADVTIQIAGDYLLKAANILTPNGDGKNDKWVIWNINTFPDNEVRVFDRAGRVVFYAKNYMNTWDGTYNGKPLPEGVYIYVVEVGSGIAPTKGTLTILRSHN